MYYQTPDLEAERLILHRGNMEDYKAILSKEKFYSLYADYLHSKLKK